MEEGNLIRPDLQETKENDMMKVLGTEIKGKFLWIQTGSEK